MNGAGAKISSLFHRLVSYSNSLIYRFLNQFVNSVQLLIHRNESNPVTHDATVEVMLLFCYHVTVLLILLDRTSFSSHFYSGYSWCLNSDPPNTATQLSTLQRINWSCVQKCLPARICSTPLKLPSTIPSRVSTGNDCLHVGVRTSLLSLVM